MAMIKNPILPGFNPDPCILRVGEDYYVATSTFEWAPGVQIHHSRDLVNWRLLCHPLTRDSQLPMAGNPDSGGIWAPCLTHDGRKFHLIYTNVRSLHGIFKDTHNYLVTAENVEGPWSEPVYLNSSGFDPSLFHDDDGRKWLVNMLWDFRPGKNRFAGILLQEYSEREHRLVGPIRNIFKGTKLGITEGPHLYKWRGMYYLLVAEGGTSWAHAVTIARSKNIDGPYEVHPQNPILTSLNTDATLQKAGHGSICDTTSGEWYMVHLCARPLMPEKRCTLGRETGIQKLVWGEDGWPRLAGSGNLPRVEVEGPSLVEHRCEKLPARDDFEGKKLRAEYVTLREHAHESFVSLKSRLGWLRLVGRESISSRHNQTLLARRVQAFKTQTTTKVEFSPEDFQQMAGLTAFYDVNNFYYLVISRDENAGRCVRILAANAGKHTWPMGEEVIALPASGAVYLRAAIDHRTLQFSWSRDGETFEPVGPVLDASLLSDETTGSWAFTGTMVGVCCQDVSGRRAHADFDWLEYQEG